MTRARAFDHRMPVALDMVEAALALTAPATERHTRLLRIWQRLWDEDDDPYLGQHMRLRERGYHVMTFCHHCSPMLEIFIDRLATALNVSPCRHGQRDDEPFRHSVRILKEFNDEARAVGCPDDLYDVPKCVEYFRFCGYDCDCAILDDGDDDDGCGDDIPPDPSPNLLEPVS
jgi:hypothetical protein